MARCSYDQLQDLEVALDELRLLPLLTEKKPGIFYIKNQGFLHFHIQDGNRWADVKDGDHWKEIELPLKPTKKILQEFVKEIKKRYEAIIA